MYVPERKAAYEKLRTYKKEIESGEAAVVNPSTSVDSKPREVITIDDDTQSPSSQGSASTMKLGQDAANVTLEVKSEPKVKREYDNEGGEPTAKKLKMQPESEITTHPVGDAATTTPTPNDEDDIAKLEEEAAKVKRQIEEAEALAEMRKRSAALEAKLEAAKARKRVGSTAHST